MIHATFEDSNNAPYHIVYKDKKSFLKSMGRVKHQLIDAVCYSTFKVMHNKDDVKKFRDGTL